MVFLTIILSQTCCDSDIYRNLKYYETIHASEIGHRIVKRGANPSNHKYNTIKEIDFKALGKNFRLILSPAKGKVYLFYLIMLFIEL